MKVHALFNFHILFNLFQLIAPSLLVKRNNVAINIWPNTMQFLINWIWLHMKKLLKFQVILKIFSCPFLQAVSLTGPN